jgi:copper chaperone NosL
VTRWLTALALAPLIACGEPEVADAPAPEALTRDATGYYCHMIVVDHQGPKAQIRLESQEEPLWFTQVRDALAFVKRPEEPKDIAAIYVNDMGAAGSWADPGAGNWTLAERAHYVIGSSMRGGMGAPEAVPFAEQAAALAFAAEHGGRVVAYADVPEDYVTAEVGEADMERAMEQMHHEDHQ